MGMKVNTGKRDIIDSTMIVISTHLRCVPPKDLDEGENLPRDPKVRYSAGPDASWI